MIDIEQITLKQAREIASLFGLAGQRVSPQDHPFNIGGKYFIRTVTHHHTGILLQVTPTELVLTDAAWIADDGRLTAALKSGDFSEVEMFPAGSKVIIGRGSLIDALEISTIPTSQK